MSIFEGLMIKKVPKTPGDFEQVEFVMRARCQDRGRVNLYNLFEIEDGKIYATDGHRVHFAEFSGEYLGGVYRFLAKKSGQFIFEKCGEEFPDCKRVLPNLDGCSGDYEIDFGAHEASGICQIIRNMSNDFGINYDFLKDLREYFVVYLPKDPQSGIYFSNPNKGAMIMPLKLAETAE
jgi:hypothetical protein